MNACHWKHNKQASKKAGYKLETIWPLKEVQRANCEDRQYPLPTVYECEIQDLHSTIQSIYSPVYTRLLTRVGIRVKLIRVRVDTPNPDSNPG